MKSFFGSAVMAAFLAGTFGAFVTPAHAVTVTAGDLIRGTTFSAVYYMGVDGLRYVFPNEKTYITWYHDSSWQPDFSEVVTISDADLADIQMGGNVTYRPGVKMLKINSKKDVYVVTQGGVLHHVDSEALATELYGSDWARDIDDVPDAYFNNYTVSDESVEDLGNWSPAEETAAVPSIAEDKNLLAPEYIEISDNGYDPIDVTICVNQNVKFTNTGDDKHTATSDDLTWGTGTLQSGDSYIRKFTEEDTVTFYDGYDSSNTGAIYVETCE